jgi:putative transposase
MQWLSGCIEKRVKELFYEITEEHDFGILARELMPDHVHLFLSAAPKWAPRKNASVFKNIRLGSFLKSFHKSKRSCGTVIIGAPGIMLRVRETK